MQYSFSCPGGYFTIDFDFSNSPIVSLSVLRIAAATTCAFPFEGEYCVNCKILWVCIFCDWISFFGLPIKSYSGLRLLVYKKYTLKEPDSRFTAYRAFGVRKAPRINKIKLDLDSGLERPTAIYWLSTNQTQSRQNQEKATAKTKTNLSHNRANFRIEKQKRKRKARSSMRIPKVR